MKTRTKSRVRNWTFEAVKELVGVIPSLHGISLKAVRSCRHKLAVGAEPPVGKAGGFPKSQTGNQSSNSGDYSVQFQTRKDCKGHDILALTRISLQ